MVRFFALVFPFFQLSVLSCAGRERVRDLQGCFSPACADTTFPSFLQVCRTVLDSQTFSDGGCDLCDIVGPKSKHTLIQRRVFYEANTIKILSFSYASSHGSFNVTVRGDD